MTLKLTLGSIIRFVNTIGAAYGFAVGSYILGSILACLVIGSVILEDFEFESDREE